MDRNCVFCRIISGQQHGAFVYKDERVVAFLDINQVARGHLLVVPRTHVSFWWELADEDAAAIAIAAKPLLRALRQVFNPDGMKVEQRNGRAAGQDVFHVHLHLIPIGGGRGEHWADPPTLDARAAQIRAALEKTDR